MRSLRKTLLLAVLASVLLVLAILHSWPTRVYSTVDVWQKHLLERLPQADHRLSNISFHVRDDVARYARFYPQRSQHGDAGADVFPSAACWRVTDACVKVRAEE